MQVELVEKLAKVAVGLYTANTPVGELFKYVHHCQEAFGLTGEEFTELLDIIIQLLKNGDENGKEH